MSLIQSLNTRYFNQKQFVEDIIDYANQVDHEDIVVTRVELDILKKYNIYELNIPYLKSQYLDQIMGIGKPIKNQDLNNHFFSPYPLTAETDEDLSMILQQDTKYLQTNPTPLEQQIDKELSKLVYFLDFKYSKIKRSRRSKTKQWHYLKNRRRKLRMRKQVNQDDQHNQHDQHDQHDEHINQQTELYSEIQAKDTKIDKIYTLSSPDIYSWNYVFSDMEDSKPISLYYIPNYHHQKYDTFQSEHQLSKSIIFL